MTDREPVQVTNLDRYGSPPLPWSRPHDLLVASPAQPGTPYFLGTSRPDGRPHAASVGAGPPPWHLYLFTFHTAFGVATAEPHGATRWRFER
jgi:hypothetical protein